MLSLSAYSQCFYLNETKSKNTIGSPNSKYHTLVPQKAVHAVHCDQLKERDKISALLDLLKLLRAKCPKNKSYDKPLQHISCLWLSGFMYHNPHLYCHVDKSGNVYNKVLPVPNGNRARGEQAESHEATAPELEFGICCEWSHRLSNAIRLI